MRLPTFLLTVAFCTAPALAVGTSNWTHTNEADFKNGTFDNVVATNLGDLKLSRAVKTLLEQDPQVSSVNALAEGPDGAVYAGTGPHGMLLRIKGEQVTTVATLEDATNIFCLLFDKQGRLLIGTGGEHGRILRIDKPGADGKDAKPTEVFKAEGVQYVWSVRQTPDGNLYAATGPTGQLFEIEGGAAAPRVVLDSDENNLTSLASDGKDTLYVGTDPNGLVYRVNRKTGESFVLYDAAETEISALVLDKQGNLYAATAEAKDEGGAAAAAAAAEGSGRPEGGASGVPITSDPPKDPKPPTLPDPNPGRPAPIPKAAPGPEEDERKSGVESEDKLRAQRPVGRTFLSVSGILAQGQLKDGQECPAAGRTDKNVCPTILSSGAVSRTLFLIADAEAEAEPQAPPHPPALPNPPGGQQPATRPSGPRATPGRQAVVDAGDAAEPRPAGNAVYKIDPDGFVTEVFRQPVLILSMVESDGALLLATGSEGQIYQVNPASEETVVLARVEPKQVMCLLPAKDGRLYMGLANVGGVAAMSGGFATTGTYTSPVLDATQISRFGKMHLHGSLAEGTSLTVATRSGNVKDASERGWSRWSDEVPATQYLAVTSPSARFLQYRLTFASKEGKQTSVVQDVSIAYQVPNQPPTVRAVRATGIPDEQQQQQQANAAAAGGVDAMHGGAGRRQQITWEAADPNNDALQYAVYFRRSGGGEGDGGEAASPWILLKEKLAEASFEWDTRTVADGRYELRLVASDAAANVPGKGKTAARVSDPILVDNTPPAVGDVRSAIRGGEVTIEFRAVDRTGVLASAEYSVDSSKDWQAVLPSDSIWDGPEESATFRVNDLSPGTHQVTIRATDARGNQAFENVFVTVPNRTVGR